jgi:hypothetical protein
MLFPSFFQGGNVAVSVAGVVYFSQHVTTSALQVALRPPLKKEKNILLYAVTILLQRTIP